MSSSGNENVVFTVQSLPTAPPSTSSRTLAVCGWWRYMNASVSTRPLASAAANASSTSAALREYGFSQSTCLPAASARIVHSWCMPFGREM